MSSGTIVLYKEDKGYGFIKPTDSDKNVYVHISAVTAAGLTTLTAGQNVSYDLHTEGDKISAINLAIIGA